MYNKKDIKKGRRWFGKGRVIELTGVTDTTVHFISIEPPFSREQSIDIDKFLGTVNSGHLTSADPTGVDMAIARLNNANS